MRFLLTSSGISNPSINDALVGLLGKPIAESSALIEKWASGVPVPTYGIEDETAIRVTDGRVVVLSEGHWKLFAPSAKAENTYIREEHRR